MLKPYVKIINIKWNYEGMDLDEALHLPREAYFPRSILTDTEKHIVEVDENKVKKWLSETYGHGQKVEDFDVSSGYKVTGITWKHFNNEPIYTQKVHGYLPTEVILPINVTFSDRAIEEYLKDRYGEDVLFFSIEKDEYLPPVLDDVPVLDNVNTPTPENVKSPTALTAQEIARLAFENDIPLKEVEVEYDILTNKDKIDEFMEEYNIPEDCRDEVREEVIRKMYDNSDRNIGECVNEAYQELYIDMDRD